MGLLCFCDIILVALRSLFCAFFFFIKKNFLSVLVCMVTEETVEEEKRYDLWLFLLVTGGS